MKLLIPEQDLENVQNLLSNLDRSMGNLMDSIEEMKPAYLHAMKLLSQANPPSAAQKNNLVFYGLAPEPLEVQVSKTVAATSKRSKTIAKQIFFHQYFKFECFMSRKSFLPKFLVRLQCEQSFFEGKLRRIDFFFRKSV